MNIFVLNKRRILRLFLTLTILAIITYFILLVIHNKNNRLFIGGTLNDLEEDRGYDKVSSPPDYESYFRPSCAPLINTKNVTDLLNQNAEITNYTQVKINDDIFKEQENMLIYYFSILREAYNLQDGLGAGCGSLGYTGTPYMISYNFLSNDYMKKVSYSDYHNSFKNVLHINLIKLIKVQNDENDSINQKYLFEIETIQGTKNNSGAFVYYYGFIYVKNQDNLYKINNIVTYPEVYLCAPYHGWSYSAEAIIDIEYGGWCSMVKEKYETKYDGDIKSIEFKSFDNKNYVIKFVTLANDTDVQIGQYLKKEDGTLEETYISVTSCLDNKNKKDKNNQ